MSAIVWSKAQPLVNYKDFNTASWNLWIVSYKVEKIEKFECVYLPEWAIDHGICDNNFKWYPEYLKLKAKN